MEHGRRLDAVLESRSFSRRPRTTCAEPFARRWRSWRPCSTAAILPRLV